MRYLLALLLAGCAPAADASAIQALQAARAGDLLVYQSLDGGWQRGVVRGSVCAEERALRAKHGAFDASSAVVCSADGGAE